MAKQKDITYNQLTNIKPVTDSQKIVFDSWKKSQNQPNTDSALTLVPINDLLDYWKEKKMFISIDHLDDARMHGIVGEAIVGADASSLSIEVNYLKLKKLLPNIQFINRILESNQQKSTMA